MKSVMAATAENEARTESLWTATDRAANTKASGHITRMVTYSRKIPRALRRTATLLITCS
jgi:hypothetical protein